MSIKKRLEDFFDTEIPGYLNKLHIFANLSTHDKKVVIDLLTTENVRDIEYEIVTYRQHLRREIQRHIDSLADAEPMEALKHHSEKLAEIAHMAVLDLFPEDSHFRKIVGQPKDYEVFRINKE